MSIAKKHGLDPWDLIYVNFKTRDAAEVNWYLRNYVGCKLPTDDGKNWMFTASAKKEGMEKRLPRPGFIYIPRRKIMLSPIYVEWGVPKPGSGFNKVWAGLGKYHSGDLVVVGAHDLTAKIYNLGGEYPNVKNAVINVNGYKFGIGLGADVSAVFVIAHGYENAGEMKGVSGEWDFDIALAAKLSDFLKDVRGLGKVIDTFEKFKKMRYFVEQGIKNASITKRGIYTIPIPFAGGGLHLWGGYKFGDVTVVSAGVGIP